MTSEDEIPFVVSLGHVGDDSFILRFPLRYSDEVLALLDDHQIDHNTAAEFSAGPTEWLEVVKVLGVSGGLAALASVIKTFVRRNDGKKIVLKRDGDKVEVEAAGYSAKQVEQFLEKRQEEQVALDKETRRILGLPAVDSKGPRDSEGAE